MANYEHLGDDVQRAMTDVTVKEVQSMSDTLMDRATLIASMTDVEQDADDILLMCGIACPTAVAILAGSSFRAMVRHFGPTFTEGTGRPDTAMDALEEAFIRAVRESRKAVESDVSETRANDG